MSGKERSAKDKEMASYLKKTGKVAPRHWNGVGRSDVVGAEKLGMAWRGRASSTWERGMAGGVLSARLGFPAEDVPQAMVVWSEEREGYNKPRGSRRNYGHKVKHNNFRITLTGNASTELEAMFAEAAQKYRKSA